MNTLSLPFKSTFSLILSISCLCILSTLMDYILFFFLFFFFSPFAPFRKCHLITNVLRTQLRMRGPVISRAHQYGAARSVAGCEVPSIVDLPSHGQRATAVFSTKTELKLDSFFFPPLLWNMFSLLRFFSTFNFIIEGKVDNILHALFLGLDVKQCKYSVIVGGTHDSFPSLGTRYVNASCTDSSLDSFFFFFPVNAHHAISGHHTFIVSPK